MERDGEGDVDKRNLCFTTSWSSSSAGRGRDCDRGREADEVAAVEDAVKVAVDVRVVVEVVA